MNQPSKHRNIYGQRKGRPLRKSQREYLDKYLDRLNPLGSMRKNHSRGHLLDMVGLFGRDLPIWLEIGFGSGEYMIHLAKQNPDIGIIGCEPYIRGVASLLGRMTSFGLENIRVYPGDVRDLFDVLPDCSIDKTFLLYPDPWPKRRHHKRRFVRPDFLNPLARVMKVGSELRIVTDIPDYARQSIEQFHWRSDFVWSAQSPRDWQASWSDWTATRYEKKALREGRVPIYLTFKRS